MTQIELKERILSHWMQVNRGHQVSEKPSCFKYSTYIMSRDHRAIVPEIGWNYRNYLRYSVNIKGELK